MADYNIIEFIVYGLIGYSGLAMMIFGSLTNPPTEKSLAAIRAVSLIPSVFCIALLMFAGGFITLDTTTETVTMFDVNNTKTGEETHVKDSEYQLINPIWGVMHFVFFILLIIYIITQFFMILTK